MPKTTNDEDFEPSITVDRIRSALERMRSYGCRVDTIWVRKKDGYYSDAVREVAEQNGLRVSLDKQRAHTDARSPVALCAKESGARHTDMLVAQHTR